MKILMVHEDTRNPGEGGGAESLLRDQTQALRALGHEIEWWQGRNVPLSTKLVEFQPDVVHLMTIHNFIGMGAALTAQKSGIPTVWHLQDYWPFCGNRMCLVDQDRSCPAVNGVCDDTCQSRPAPTEWREIVNRSYIVAGNEYTAAIYRRNGVRCDAVVGLGVDIERFQPDPSMRSPEPSIYASSAWPEHPVKGMHILRQALEGTPWKANLLAHMTRDDLARELRRAHIYVFPSCYEETWGLCLTEAMATGCACIASDVAGAKAQITDGFDGLLVPKRDPEALREAIRQLMLDVNLRERLGYRARKTVEQARSLEAMGRQWNAVYSEVLDRRLVGGYA